MSLPHLMPYHPPYYQCQTSESTPSCPGLTCATQLSLQPIACATQASPHLCPLRPLRLLPLLRGGAVSGLVLCLRAKPLDCLIAILTFNTAHRALLKVQAHTAIRPWNDEERHAKLVAVYI